MSGKQFMLFLMLSSAFLLFGFFIGASLKVHDEPSYQLLYVDEKAQEWVLDYDMTLYDCMKALHASTYDVVACEVQDD